MDQIEQTVDGLFHFSKGMVNDIFDTCVDFTLPCMTPD